MKRIIRILVLLLALGVLTPQVSYATEEQQIEQEEAKLEEPAKDPRFITALKEKYQLTDEQIKAMEDANLRRPHMAMTAQLAATSGKSIDEVLKMRTEQNMGWGAIAKELGVHPGELGRGVSSLRHEVKGDRKADKVERAAAREERKQARKDKHEDRKEQRAERKQQRQDKKNKDM